MQKQGWVNGPRDGPSWSRRTVMDSVVPYIAISSAALFIPLNVKYEERHRHNGLSRVFVSKYFNSWNLVLGSLF